MDVALYSLSYPVPEGCTRVRVLNWKDVNTFHSKQQIQKRDLERCNTGFLERLINTRQLVLWDSGMQSTPRTALTDSGEDLPSPNPAQVPPVQHATPGRQQKCSFRSQKGVRCCFIIFLFLKKLQNQHIFLNFRDIYLQQ